MAGGVTLLMVRLLDSAVLLRDPCEMHQKHRICKGLHRIGGLLHHDKVEHIEYLYGLSSSICLCASHVDAN